MTTTRQPQLVTLGQMARRLGVTPAWLRTEATAGRLPYLSAGERLLFRADIVTQILAERAAVEGLQQAEGKPE